MFKDLCSLFILVRFFSSADGWCSRCCHPWPLKLRWRWEVVVQSVGREEMAPAAEKGDRGSVGVVAGEGLLLTGWRRWQKEWGLLLCSAATGGWSKERGNLVRPVIEKKLKQLAWGESRKVRQIRGREGVKGSLCWWGKWRGSGLVLSGREDQRKRGCGRPLWIGKGRLAAFLGSLWFFAKSKGGSGRFCFAFGWGEVSGRESVKWGVRLVVVGWGRRRKGDLFGLFGWWARNERGLVGARRVGLRVRWLEGLLVGEDDSRVLSSGFFLAPSFFFLSQSCSFFVCVVETSI